MVVDRVGEFGAIKIRASEIGAGQVCAGEGRVVELRADEVRAGRVRAEEFGVGRVRLPEGCAGRVRAGEIGVSEVPNPARPQPITYSSDMAAQEAPVNIMVTGTGGR